MPEVEFRSLDQRHDQALSGMRISRLLSLFVLLLPLHTFAEVYDVSTTPELREALASAAEAGGDNTIRLAAGTYSTQDDGEGMFRYTSTLSATLSLVAQNKNQKPLLDGAGADTILELYCPEGNLSLVVDSIRFENAGDAAIRTVDSFIQSVDVTNSEFRNNISTRSGGAIRIRNLRTGSITGSIFEGNKAPDSGSNGGGAIYLQNVVSNLEITASTFINNEGRRGSAIYRSSLCNGLTIKNSRFEGNSIWLNCSSDLISNNYFEGAGIRQGGLISNVFFNGFYVSTSTAINNVFISMSGVQAHRANNNLFYETPLTANDEDVLANNIFIGSESTVNPSGGNPIRLTLSNNYIDPSAIASNVLLEGDGNIFEGLDLGFVNADEGDYRLTSSSDLIDAGTTDPELAYITDYDYTGTTARVIGASVDIGPYEYDGEAPPDSDGDGLNDNIDNCPSVANEDQADFDSDGEGDACDSDDDNDGTNDGDDAFPFDDTESLDTDGDGIGNNEDEDDDGDGFLDDSDPQPVIANVFAIDSDGDGVADSIDDYPTDATKQYSGSGDLDGDGYSNDEEVDYCSNPFDKNSQPDTGGLSTPMIHLLTEQ